MAQTDGRREGDKHGTHLYINVNGIRLHYVQNGDRSKSLMVFLHGFPEFSYKWRHQLAHFGRKHWVIAPDLRGFGKSEKPRHVDAYDYEILVQDIVHLVEELGEGRQAVLVGHDWGGFIAWGVAAKYPALVSKLIVINAPHPNLWLHRERTSSFFQYLKSAYVAFFRVPHVPEAFVNVATRLAFPGMYKAVPFIHLFLPSVRNWEDMLVYKKAFNCRASFKGPINYYRNHARRVRTAVELGKVEAPTFIIWAAPDVYLDQATPELCKQFVNGEPRVEFVRERGSSHFCVAEEPEVLNNLIESFVYSTTTS